MARDGQDTWTAADPIPGQAAASLAPAGTAAGTLLARITPDKPAAAEPMVRADRVGLLSTVAATPTVPPP